MKKDIHPKYEKTVIKCACGNEIETKSTADGEVHVELCSACHPFFTGKQKFVDTAGRVDKFRARMEAADLKKKDKDKDKKESKKEPSNKEKLEVIKEKVAKPQPTEHEDAPSSASTEVTQSMPGEVTQEQSSAEENIAAEELLDSNKLVPNKAKAAENKEN